MDRLNEFIDKIIKAGKSAESTESEWEQMFGECQEHGKFPLNFRDEHGVERWRPNVCPVCKRRKRAQSLLARAEIAPRFMHCSFDNYVAETTEQQRALNVCRAYADTFSDALATGRSLVLWGNPGTGKNHLAVAIMRSILERGYTALSATAYEIVRRIRQTWRSDENESDVIGKFAEVDLLVIDEVGRQYGTDGEALLLFQVIDERYRRLKPMVVISNRTPDEIRAYIGDAAFDRLREGGGVMVPFNWASYRGRN